MSRVDGLWYGTLVGIVDTTLYTALPGEHVLIRSLIARHDGAGNVVIEYGIGDTVTGSLGEIPMGANTFDWREMGFVLRSGMRFVARASVPGAIRSFGSGTIYTN